MGFVERFEISALLNGKPQVLTLSIACGYNVNEDKIASINEFLDTKKATRIDLNTLLSVLTYLKELELMNEKDTEGDEYCNLLHTFLSDYSGCIRGFRRRA